MLQWCKTPITKLIELSTHKKHQLVLWITETMISPLWVLFYLFSHIPFLQIAAVSGATRRAWEEWCPYSTQATDPNNLYELIKFRICEEFCKFSCPIYDTSIPHRVRILWIAMNWSILGFVVKSWGFVRIRHRFVAYSWSSQELTKPRMN